MTNKNSDIILDEIEKNPLFAPRGNNRLLATTRIVEGMNTPLVITRINFAKRTRRVVDLQEGDVVKAGVANGHVNWRDSLRLVADITEQAKNLASKVLGPIFN